MMDPKFEISLLTGPMIATALDNYEREHQKIVDKRKLLDEAEQQTTNILQQLREACQHVKPNGAPAVRGTPAYHGQYRCDYCVKLVPCPCPSNKRDEIKQKQPETTYRKGAWTVTSSVTHVAYKCRICGQQHRSTHIEEVHHE